MELSAVMVQLSLRELTDRIDGDLTLGSPHPLGGEWAPMGPVVVDSRCVRPGDVFWSLPGPRRDGSDYALDALMRSAQGTVVAGRHIEPWAGCFSVRVEDTLEALLRLAASLRREFAGTIVGVYGDAPDGPMCRMIDQVLRHVRTGTVDHVAEGDCVRLALGMLEWQLVDDYAVVGISGREDFDFDAISHLCCPSIAAIYSPSHTRRETDGEHPPQTLSLTRWLRTLPRDSTAVVFDDEQDPRHAAAGLPLETVWVGAGMDCDLVVKPLSRNGDQWHVRFDGRSFKIPVSDCLCWSRTCVALAVGKLLGLSTGELQSALQRPCRENTGAPPRGHEEPLEVPSSTLALREVDVTLPPGLKRHAR
jgi:UDP-N-acetylmuramoyl-tripeptide--D-alanyl-D-alanine ligase